MKLHAPLAAIALTAAVATGTTISGASPASASQCPATKVLTLNKATNDLVLRAHKTKQPVVFIKHCVFGKPDHTVKAGAKVLVVNLDNVPHTWESTVKAFDSGLIQGGHAKSVAIPKKAKKTYSIKCDIHSFMHGTLSIKVV